MTRLTTCPDAEGVAARAAALVERQLERACEQRGEAHIAVSGGTTPERTFELLAAGTADWSAVEVWFADERCVPPEDEQSNYRLVAEKLLEPVGMPGDRVHRMEGELGPEPGARRYAAALAERLGRGAATPPPLDLVLLGIGPDGHIASLFPGSSTLRAGKDVLCLGVEDSPKPPPQRITLSFAMLSAARACLLLASGSSKADAVAAMLGRPTPHVPASLLRRERLSVIVDDAAAPPAPPR